MGGRAVGQVCGGVGRGGHRCLRGEGLRCTVLTPNSHPALPPHTLLPPPPLLPSRELKRARHIGSFESEEDAARAYDREAIKMLGPDAGLNFRESEWMGGRGGTYNREGVRQSTR